MMDFDLAATQILQSIGGKSNFEYCTTCATRLKIFVRNRNKVDEKALEKIDGVKGIFESLGAIQLIVGAYEAEELAFAVYMVPYNEGSRMSNSSLYFNANRFIPAEKNEIIRAEQENTVSSNGSNIAIQINIENLNIYGLTFNQLIQYNRIGQNAVPDISEQITVYANFITYITKGIQYNDDMARDVIIILKTSPDTEVRNLGYDMQKESRESRNPLAKLRRWILEHKDDATAAKKFFDALSSAASFAKKWGPKLAKFVGL